MEALVSYVWSLVVHQGIIAVQIYLVRKVKIMFSVCRARAPV